MGAAGAGRGLLARKTSAAQDKAGWYHFGNEILQRRAGLF
jgi:hypothetical protein